MVKRLCKLSRQEITTSLANIERLVAEPQYLCRACARVAADKKSLCKPQAMRISSAKTSVAAQSGNSKSSGSLPSSSRLKKQKKFHKKLEKVLKKQRKLLKKQQKLEGKMGKADSAAGQNRATEFGIH